MQVEYIKKEKQQKEADRLRIAEEKRRLQIFCSIHTVRYVTMLLCKIIGI